MLNDKICKKREELNKSIEENKDYAEIYRISVELKKVCAFVMHILYMLLIIILCKIFCTCYNGIFFNYKFSIFFDFAFKKF